ncbi:serine/threonine protein kinase [Streptomyces sp. NA04227]|uniref:serine/threonine-protein kinase n=1 Tax=Streptomyces sp. NA04227 TaxID=2742136 RepID=UPI001590D017|nr:serine/threonine-protein kinase [Streptomyces sp. NA04227]QKW06336.1 serine/threonine protein kinase [Streptomyces sp. NA04227]
MRIGTVVNGRYRLVRGPLQGGMGEVWLAEDEDLSRPVVLKRVLAADAGQERIDRLRAEGRALARFSHPHVVTLFTVEEIRTGRRTTSWLVMEYVAGGSLDHRPPLNPERVARIGVQIADALAALHAEGIVHGDVKPGNVVVTPDGLAKLADFGAAYRVGGRETITQNGAVSYTPDFASPEMVAGQPQRASDVFSLGAMLYYLVTGLPPRPGARRGVDPFVAEQQAARGETALDADCGILAEVLPSMLARDPDERPAAHEVRARLEQVAGAQGPLPPADTGEEDMTRTAPGAGRAAAAGGAGGAAGGTSNGLAGGGRWAAATGSVRRRPALYGTLAGVVVLAVVGTLWLTSLGGGDNEALDGDDPKSGPSASTSSPPRTHPRGSVFGDHRSADPCALTEPAALAEYGESERDRDYGNFDRCDVLVDTGTGDPVDVEVNLDFGGHSELAAPARTVGGIGIVTDEPESDECGRTLLPPDKDVTVVVRAKQDDAGDGGGASLCTIADTAADSAAEVLDRGPLPRRSPPLTAASLAQRDACTLLTAQALEIVPGIDARDPDIGYGNWDCEWASTTNGLWIELRFDRGPAPSAEDGTPTRIGGRDAVVEPEGEGEETCRVRVVHRSYRDDHGESAVETVNLTVGGEDDPARLRQLATELAHSAVGELNNR